MQFEARKEKIKDLMEDLLYEDKSFRYQITLKVLLKNDKSNVEIEFRPVYFNTSIKTVTRQKFYLSESLQEVLYLVDNLINEGSGLVIEDINRFFVNVSLYQPLYGSSYVNLPVEQLHSRKRLISIKKKDFKCFLWCHVRAINPVKRNPKKITKHDKKIVNKLHYSGIDFPLQENDYKKK